MVDEFDGFGEDVCHETVHHGHADDTTRATELRLEHFIPSSCKPHSWQDFFVRVTPEVRRNNILFEVTLLTLSRSRSHSTKTL